MNRVSLKSRLVQAQNQLTIRLVRIGYRNTHLSRLTRIGTYYGGWYLPKSILHSSKKKTLISLGVGFDVSFDKELLSHGFNAILLDPLYECISYAKRELAGVDSCFFENRAISNINGVENFFPPKNPKHDSWSSTNIQSSAKTSAKSFEVVSLDRLMSKYEELTSDTWLYLKMDVEGAEVKVIPDIYNSEMKFSFVGIELDFLSLIPFLGIKRRVNAILLARKFLKGMLGAGYTFVHSDNFNFYWEGNSVHGSQS